MKTIKKFGLLIALTTLLLSCQNDAIEPIEDDKINETTTLLASIEGLKRNGSKFSGHISIDRLKNIMESDLGRSGFTVEEAGKYLQYELGEYLLTSKTSPNTHRNQDTPSFTHVVCSVVVYDGTYMYFDTDSGERTELLNKPSHRYRSRPSRLIYLEHCGSVKWRIKYIS